MSKNKSEKTLPQKIKSLISILILTDRTQNPLPLYQQNQSHFY